MLLMFCSKHPLGKLGIQRGKLPADYLNVREVERIVLLVAFSCKRLSVSGTREYGGHSVTSTDRSFPGCCVSLATVSPVTDARAGVGCVPGNLSSTRWGERPRRCPARTGGRAGLQGTVCHGEQEDVSGDVAHPEAGAGACPVAPWGPVVTLLH